VATCFACLIEAVINPDTITTFMRTAKIQLMTIILQGTVDKKQKHAATFSFKEQVVSTGIASR